VHVYLANSQASLSATVRSLDKRKLGQKAVENLEDLHGAETVHLLGMPDGVTSARHLLLHNRLIHDMGRFAVV
jgi:hypothetical protein